AVQKRQTFRYLLFDERMHLCGRRFVKERKTEMARPVEQPCEMAFTGIHVISPRLLERISEEGVFFIIQSYLRLASVGEKIAGYRTDGDYWRDLGKPEDLAKAAEDFNAGAFAIGEAQGILNFKF